MPQKTPFQKQVFLSASESETSEQKIISKII